MTYNSTFNCKFRIYAILVFFNFLLLIFSTSVLADGFVHIYDPDLNSWELKKEQRQLCAINYTNGLEKMILAIEVGDLQGEKAVWILPVPAEPDKTVIDIIKKFPRLWGYEIKEAMREVISLGFTTMRVYQFYALPVLNFYFRNRYAGYGAIGAAERGPTDVLEEGITIHQHIEKMGFTTELVTAKDGDKFYDYLKTKGLTLPTNSKSNLNEYIGKEYSFVISWISDIEKFKQEVIKSGQYRYNDSVYTLGVTVTFPSDTIYFPLKPTSVYGKEKIPILIYVMGFVTPKLYPEIEKNTQVNYFVNEEYYPPAALSFFFDGQERIRDLKYTKIKIRTPSNNLIKDLSVTNSVTSKIVLLDYLYKHPVIILIIGIILFVSGSCLASMLAGMVAFREYKSDKKKFALFGLWNLLTLIVFIVATTLFRTEEPKPESEKSSEKRLKIVWNKRKILFVILFTAFFLIITFIFQALFLLLVK